MTAPAEMASSTAGTSKKALEFLKKPQGIVILALALGAGYLWWTRGANAQAVANVPVEQTPIGGNVDDRVPPGSASGSTPTVTTPQDNAQWHTAGVALLTALAFDAAFAETSLAKFLGGEPLSLAQRAAVSLVLARLGSPPNGAPSIVMEPPPVVVPPPVNATGVPKPKGSVIRIAQKGDTWQLYIGRYFSHSGSPSTDATMLATWSALHGGSPVVTPGVKIALPTSTPGFTGVPWTS